MLIAGLALLASGCTSSRDVNITGSIQITITAIEQSMVMGLIRQSSSEGR